MKAGEIYRNLSKIGRWADERNSVRWLAARYYAGVDSLQQLREQAMEDRPVSGHHTMAPTLTKRECGRIIRLR